MRLSGHSAPTIRFASPESRWDTGCSRYSERMEIPRRARGRRPKHNSADGVIGNRRFSLRKTHRDANKFTRIFSRNIGREILNEVTQRPRIFRGRKPSLRTLSDADKNTSRNQITRRPTYRHFPINVEKPQSEICRKRKSDGRRGREGERRYTARLNREKCLSRGFTKSQDSVLLEKRRTISIFPNGGNNNE